jgi:hypothetical protein
VPRTTIVEIPPTEQAQMLAEVRRARYGYLLAVHILLLCAAQRTPTEIAAVLFCSRSSVYRVVQAYRAGHWQSWAEAAASWEQEPRQRIHALRCSTYRPTVLGPIRLNGPLARCRTSVPATIRANRSGTWCRMCNSLCLAMVPGSLRSLTSTTRQR